MSLRVCHLKSFIPASIPSRIYVKAHQMPSGIVTTEGHKLPFGYGSLWLFFHLIYGSKKCTEQKLGTYKIKGPISLASRNLKLAGAMVHLSLLVSVRNSEQCPTNEAGGLIWSLVLLFLQTKLHLPPLRAFIT